MIQYRGCVFETNSSSAHSLVILDKPFDYYNSEDAKEELWLHYDESTGVYSPNSDDLYFGRYPFRILRTFEDKLNYAYANAPYRKTVDKKTGKNYYSKEYWRISRVVKNIIPGFKKAYFDPFYGRKPSCDQNLLWTWLKQSGITMEQFLTDKTILVICDGDEYNVWKHMKQDGLINLGKIKKEI